MRENILLVLMFIPLSLLIWFGMDQFLNPGESTPWQPVSTEHEASIDANTAKSEQQMSPEVTVSKDTGPVVGVQSAQSAIKRDRAQDREQYEEQVREPDPPERVREQTEDQQGKPVDEERGDETTDSATGAETERTDTLLETAPTSDLVVSETVKIGPEHGLNVSIFLHDPECNKKFGDRVTAKVLFSAETTAIKTVSLSALDNIINLYHECGDKFIMLGFSKASEKSRKSLKRRRLNEVRYHLQHMRVSKTDILLPEKI